MSNTTLWVPAGSVTEVSVPTVEHLTIDQIRKLVEKTEGAREISSDSGTVTFKFKDKDNDLMVILVTELDDQHLVVQTLMKIAENSNIAALIALNKWNGEAFSHGTVSTLIGIDGQPFVGMQSHLTLTGGVTEANVRAWLDSFLGHINKWEEVIIPAIHEGTPDSELGGKEHPVLRAIAGGLGEAALAWFSGSSDE